MKVLVIPDVHLKPQMFEQAAGILREEMAECAVCLMDLPDDWNQQFNIDLYEQTFDAAIAFAKEFPDTRWCYGNHDLSYQWRQQESGYSLIASYTVEKKLTELKAVLPEDNPIRYVQLIDNVIFCHGGLTEEFVRDYIPPEVYDDTEAVLAAINAMGRGQMWYDASPIWFRPQYQDVKMYKPDQYLQVVGHTPVDHIIRKWTQNQNTLSCDVFSTYRDGKPIGLQNFVIVDTENWSFEDCVYKGKRTR